MSQRECAGSNWPPASIPAEQPVSISPEAVNRAGPGNIANACSLRGLPLACSSLAARNPWDPLALRQSRAAGVLQPASAAIWFRGRPVSHGRASFAPRFASIAVQVGQPASSTWWQSWTWPIPFRLPSFASTVFGLRHPVKTVSDVRRTDARRRKRDTPEGVVHCFQVSLYKVDPRLCVLTRNLLSKNDCRSALIDEVIPGRPKMPLVSKSCSFACRAERLARTRSCPDVFIVRPACPTKCVTPNSDTCEEVALGIRFQIRRMDIFNAALIDIAGSDKASGDQVSKPLCGEGVDLVVVGRFHRISCGRRLRVARCPVGGRGGAGSAVSAGPLNEPPTCGDGRQKVAAGQPETAPGRSLGRRSIDQRASSSLDSSASFSAFSHAAIRAP